jgi:hypothetical protein
MQGVSYSRLCLLVDLIYLSFGPLGVDWHPAKGLRIPGVIHDIVPEEGRAINGIVSQYR